MSRHVFIKGRKEKKKKVCLYIPPFFLYKIMQQTSTELDFIHAYLDRLSVKSVRYGQDYLTHTVPTLRIKVR